MTSSRRQFIVTVTAATTAVLAGCTGGSDDDDDSPTDCDAIDLPTTDTPPHEPTRPEHPENGNEEDEWDEHYLGEGMPDNPEQLVDQVNITLEEIPFETDDVAMDEDFIYAALYTDRDELETTVSAATNESETRIADIDFDTEAVLVIFSGFGSSSLTHEWTYAEPNCEEVHLHGYYETPHVQTTDHVSHSSAAIIEKPDDYDLERAWVSLTIDEETRFNAPTDEVVYTASTRDSEADDVDLDDTNPEDAITNIETVPVEAAHRTIDMDAEIDSAAGDGVAVHITRESDARGLTGSHDDVETFIDETDFETDSVFYLESVGSNGCYSTLSVSNIELQEDNSDYMITGDAVAESEADGEDAEACTDVLTYPAILLRVETELHATNGEFNITDAWGETHVTQSIPVEEYTS